MQETHSMATELHKKDLEIIEEKFQLRIKTSYIEISEHEGIVRELQARERDLQKHLYEEAQATKDAYATQISNDLREQADREQQKLEEVIQLLKGELSTARQESRQALEEKERQWSDLLDSRTSQALQEMKDAIGERNDLHQQLSNCEQDKHKLEAELASVQAELAEKVQQFASYEESMVREVDTLNSRLADQFKVSEELATSQNKARELKDALKLHKQEAASLDSLVKTKDMALERAAKEAVQLKKRITWVT